MNDLQHGLAVLIESAKRIDKILYSEIERTGPYALLELPEHPFGLSLQLRESPSRWSGVAFFGYPSYSDSVNTFAAYVADRFTHAPADCSIRLMRRIMAESDPTDRQQHSVYFEIMISGDVYMVGGCSDCSGAGGTAKKKMDGLFAVFSALSGVEVKTVTIPFEKAEAVERTIEQAYGAYVGR